MRLLMLTTARLLAMTNSSVAQDHKAVYAMRLEQLQWEPASPVLSDVAQFTSEETS